MRITKERKVIESSGPLVAWLDGDFYLSRRKLKAHTTKWGRPKVLTYERQEHHVTSWPRFTHVQQKNILPGTTIVFEFIGDWSSRRVKR